MGNLMVTQLKELFTTNRTKNTELLSVLLTLKVYERLATFFKARIEYQ